MKYKSLSHRFLTFFILANLITYLLVTSLITAIFTRVYTQNTNSLVGTAMSSMSSNVTTYIDELKKLTLMPYYNQELYHYLEKCHEGKSVPAVDKARFNNMMSSSYTFVKDSRKDTTGIFIVDQQSCVFCTINNSHEYALKNDYDYAAQNWYQDAVKSNGRAVIRLLSGTDYLIPEREEPIISIARTIVNLQTREPICVIRIDVDTTFFDKIFKDFQFNIASKIMVFDDQNDLLYSNSATTAGDLQTIQSASSGSIRISDGNWKVYSSSIEGTGWNIHVLLSNDEYSKSILQIRLFALLIYLAATILAAIFYRRMTNKIVASVKDMNKVFSAVQHQDLSARYTYHSGTDLDTLGQDLNKTVIELDTLVKEKYILKIKQKESEFSSLQAQIQPHFLFNTINNFISLNQSHQSELLNTSLYNFAELLRYTLKAPSIVRLQSELKILSDYCQLQELRFGDRLSHRFDIQADTQNIQIPKLLLQPLLENSVIHGCEPSSSLCQIAVTVQEEENGTLIQIKDNGVGFDSSAGIPDGHVGLKNVKERLLLYSPSSTFTVESKPGAGTCNTIFLVKKEKEIIQ